MHLERRRIRLVGWIVRRQGLHPLPTKTPRREPPLRSPRAERAFRLRCRQRSRCVALPPLTYPIWGGGCNPVKRAGEASGSEGPPLIAVGIQVAHRLWSPVHDATINGRACSMGGRGATEGLP